MRLAPDATLDPPAQSAITEAYGLGEPLSAVFVARGAMGAVNRLSTNLHGIRRHWTVKRSYWNHFTEHDIAKEVDFTRQCETAGVQAPRSIERVDGAGYLLSLNDRSDGETLYRVLEWVEGEVGRSADSRTIPPMAQWMANIHNLAVDPAGQSIDEWFIRVPYDWDYLFARLTRRVPDVADQLRTRRSDIRELTDFVNAVQESGAVRCHTDIGANNLIWSDRGPRLIDWENSGPFIPHQELGCWLRSLVPTGKSAYLAYRQAGGPAEITDVSHIASSVAVHLNYLDKQAELFLNDDHVEQHEFALEELGGAARSLESLHILDQWVKELKSSQP